MRLRLDNLYATNTIVASFVRSLSRPSSRGGAMIWPTEIEVNRRHLTCVSVTDPGIRAWRTEL
jgi:hypothetical protein